ncbi:MAG: hypothetical protein J3K34DRAFT_524486 [Monoraphidium minutum]|nr:MAG: hypothetical protein J3K34DRAFT_524486 [Monoraphidium minutum]
MTLRHAGAAWSGPTRGGGGGGGRGGRGGGGGARGRGGRGAADRQRPQGGGGEAEGGGGGGDFVVIGKAESRYIPEDDETLAALEGGSFWQTAYAAEFGEGDEGEEEDEEGEGEGEGDEGEDAEANFSAALGPELAGEGETPEQAEWREVYTSRRLPAPRLGPVAAKRVAGKGRGLVTTAAVEEGALLMVAAPLGILYCEEGGTPENEDLADHLAQNCAFTAAQLAALARLAPPGGGGGEGAAPAAEELAADAAAMGEDGVPQQPLQAPLEELYAVVNANCTGEEFEDPVLCALRGTASCGHLGLWPAAAYANHSCCPNAVGYAVGDRWVLRASEPLPAGAEVCVSYLGSVIAAPYAARQAELREKYGFDCGCDRCKAEQRAGEQLLSLQSQVYAACESEVGPALDVAIEAGDSDAAGAALARLRELRGGYEAAVKAAKPSAKARRWMQASVFPLYDLISLAADELDDAGGGGGGGSGGGGGAAPETEALAECARVAGAITRGTDGHLDLATEYMVRAETRFGPDHQESRDASRACRAGHRARYGGEADLGERLLDLLVDTRAALGVE